MSEKQETTTNYNGWANFQTWNAALWIGNDEGMYREVLEQKRLARLFGSSLTWADCRKILRRRFGRKTPDGVSWTDPRISGREMTEMIREMED